MKFDHFGVMLDCSRNAVIKPQAVKKYVDILARLGYNCLMLYTEDTYEVDNQPYFGYLRGRYSQAELKELDCYAASKGVELIPCIQTLAHLNAIFRWKTYKAFTDVNDILLCEDPRTEQLVEDMFASLEKSFTSRIVNIGMDEAHMVGLGKYLDQHGFQNRFDILLKHLNMVCRIAAKHGFKPIMWSDMFFRLANNGKYYLQGLDVDKFKNNFDKAFLDLVPKSVSLVYWDYYSNQKPHYDAMIQAHRQFDNELWFAGGFWAWSGFAPKNAMSIERTEAAMTSAVENGMKNVFFTVWGDDGQECSHFAILPSLYYAAQRAKGISDMEQIKAGFREEFGIGFDDFMLLDLPWASGHAPTLGLNPEKYMFYNDCFCGVFDCTVKEGFEPRYTQCADKLEKLATHPEFGHLFDSAAKLCRFLQLKYTIGVRTRQLYKAGDKEGLRALVADYAQLSELLEQFYRAHRTRWFADNKPFGFDIQDIRIGGLKQRLIHCRERLEAYLAGEISMIEELEETILPEFDPDTTKHNNWASQASVNVMTFGHIGR